MEKSLNPWIILSQSKFPADLTPPENVLGRVPADDFEFILGKGSTNKHFKPPFLLRLGQQ